MAAIPEEILAIAAADFAADMVKDYQVSTNPAGELVLIHQPSRIEVATFPYNTPIPMTEVFMSLLRHHLNK